LIFNLKRYALINQQFCKSVVYCNITELLQLLHSGGVLNKVIVIVTLVSVTYVCVQI